MLGLYATQQKRAATLATDYSTQGQRGVVWIFFFVILLVFFCLFSKAFVVLLVLLPLGLEAVCAIAVVASALAIVAHVEAGIHLGQRVHSQDFVDLPER